MASHSLNALPIELLVFVIENLDHVRDLAAVSQMSRRLHDVANPRLYKQAVRCQDGRPLAWAARHGLVSTLKMALEAGADANYTFIEQIRADELEKVKACVLGRWSERWDGENRTGAGAADAKWSPGTAEDNDHAGSPLSSSTSADPPSRISSTIASSDQDSVISTEGGLSQPSDVVSMSEPPPTVGAAEKLVTRRFTAIHIAASQGHDEIITLLLAHGASINAPSEYFCACTQLAGLLNDLEHPEEDPLPPPWTPLHVAICHSHTTTAKLLLSHKASPSMLHWDDSLFPEPPTPVPTALHHAAAMGLVDLLTHILLTAKIQTDPNVRDDKTLTPFYHAYAHRRWDTSVPFLLSLGADINVEVKMYIPYCAITPLGEACRLGDYEVADRLLDLGANARHGFVADNKAGCLTPLHMCCMRSAQAADKPRVESPSPDDEEREKESERGVARARTIEKLIRGGAELGVRDCFGSTPLMAARKCGNEAAIRALVKAGAEKHEHEGGLMWEIKAAGVGKEGGVAVEGR